MSEQTSDRALEALRVVRHDFKTPLTSLKMLAQIFKMGLEKGTLATDPAKTERNCRMLVEQTDKLVELADSLYEMSLIYAGRLSLERQLADLRPVIQAASESVGDKIQDLELPVNPVWGNWDTAKLERAIKYLLMEGENVEIKLAVAGGTATLSLSGGFKEPGEKALPRIFIANSIVEKHGGKLEGRYELQLPIASAEEKAS